jgi:hypothetical protein
MISGLNIKNPTTAAPWMVGGLMAYQLTYSKLQWMLPLTACFFNHKFFQGVGATYHLIKSCSSMVGLAQASSWSHRFILCAHLHVNTKLALHYFNQINNPTPDPQTQEHSSHPAFTALSLYLQFKYSPSITGTALGVYALLYKTGFFESTGQDPGIKQFQERFKPISRNSHSTLTALWNAWDLVAHSIASPITAATAALDQGRTIAFHLRK